MVEKRTTPIPRETMLEARQRAEDARRASQAATDVAARLSEMAASRVRRAPGRVVAMNLVIAPHQLDAIEAHLGHPPTDDELRSAIAVGLRHYCLLIAR